MSGRRSTVDWRNPRSPDAQRDRNVIFVPPEAPTDVHKLSARAGVLPVILYKGPSTHRRCYTRSRIRYGGNTCQMATSARSRTGTARADLHLGHARFRHPELRIARHAGRGFETACPRRFRPRTSLHHVVRTTSANVVARLNALGKLWGKAKLFHPHVSARNIEGRCAGRRDPSTLRPRSCWFMRRSRWALSFQLMDEARSVRSVTCRRTSRLCAVARASISGDAFRVVPVGIYNPRIAASSQQKRRRPPRFSLGHVFVDASVVSSFAYSVRPTSDRSVNVANVSRSNTSSSVSCAVGVSRCLSTAKLKRLSALSSVFAAAPRTAIAQRD
jgi:hypothetical protein